MNLLFAGSASDCRGDGDDGVATVAEAEDPPPGWLGWKTVLSACIGQARRWQVPPRWALADWAEEARAEAAVTLANMAYNMRRWCWLDRRSTAA